MLSMRMLQCQSVLADNLLGLRLIGQRTDQLRGDVNKKNFGIVRSYDTK